MPNSQPLNPTLAMLMAIAGSTAAAAAVMFVPAILLVARAFIAFGTGAILLGVLTVWIVWHDAKQSPALQTASVQSGAAYWSVLQGYWTDKLSLSKKDLKIGSFRDLAHFNFGDGHPDAPARRPLLASQDLPPPVSAEMARDSDARASYDPADDAPTPPSLTDMVGQFELAVAQRHQLIAELQAAVPEAAVEATGRPLLALVASASTPDDDADSALAAALATLHRMTVNAR